MLTGEYIVKDLSELEKQYKGQESWTERDRARRAVSDVIR